MVRGRAEARPARAAASRLPSPILIGGAYLLGPLSLTYLRRGGSAVTWAWTGVLSTLSLVILAWRPVPALRSLHEGSLGTLAVIATAGGMFSLAVACWARGVLLAGRETSTRRFPAWIRSPWTVGILGLVAPGLGLLVAGRPRRAAWAIVWVGFLGASAAVLATSEWLWSWWMGSFGIEGTGIELEALFLAAGATAALAAAAWLIQALDGIRLSLPESAEGHPRRDLFAFALLATLAVFPVAFRPTGLAAQLGDQAVALRLEGMRAVPLVFAVTAQRLDPSQPRYALGAADLYEDLGEWGKAKAVRAGVARRWGSVTPDLKRLQLIPSGAVPPPQGFTTPITRITSETPADVLPENALPEATVPPPPAPRSDRPVSFTP